MTPEEIVKRFATHGITARIDANCKFGCIPMFDKALQWAYVLGEEGENVILTKEPPRVLVPLFENPTAEHVDKLALAAADDEVVYAIVVDRAPGIVGLCVFVKEDFE